MFNLRKGFIPMYVLTWKDELFCKKTWSVTTPEFLLYDGCSEILENVVITWRHMESLQDACSKLKVETHSINYLLENMINLAPDVLNVTNQQRLFSQKISKWCYLSELILNLILSCCQAKDSSQFPQVQKFYGIHYGIYSTRNSLAHCFDYFHMMKCLSPWLREHLRYSRPSFGEQRSFKSKWILQ